MGLAMALAMGLAKPRVCPRAQQQVVCCGLRRAISGDGTQIPSRVSANSEASL